MSQHEQILRARLERVLSASSISPPPQSSPYDHSTKQERPRHVKRASLPAVAAPAGMGFGWLWREEGDADTVGEDEPTSPITYLPTPQTVSLGTPIHGADFFSSPESSSKRTRSRSRTDPSPPRERGRMFTLGLETVPSVDNLRASSSTTHTDMLTPPPTPPERSPHIPPRRYSHTENKKDQLQSLGVGSALGRSKSLKQVPTTPRKANAFSAGVPLTEEEELETEAERVKSRYHRRTMSAQVSPVVPLFPHNSPSSLYAPAPKKYSLDSHSSPTPSSQFNIRVASIQCRNQQGMVSFGEVEGLGEPEAESEVERDREEDRPRRWFGVF